VARYFNWRLYVSFTSFVERVDSRIDSQSS